MTVPDVEVVWTASLKRGQGNWESLLESVSTLYVHGVELEWTGLHAACRGNRIALPTYPFQRSRYWLQGRDAGQPRTTDRSDTRDENTHPFLGRRLDSPAIAGTVFETEIGTEGSELLDGHRIFGRLLVPSSASIEMAFAGAAEVLKLSKSPSQSYESRISWFVNRFFCPQKSPAWSSSFAKSPRDKTSAFEFAVEKRRRRPDTFGGHMSLAESALASRHRNLTRPGSVKKSGDDVPNKLTRVSFTTRSAAIGLDFGERFRGIVRIRRCDGEALAEIRLPECFGQRLDFTPNPPCPFGLMFSTASGCLALPTESAQNAYLPTGLERFTLFTLPPEKFWGHAVLRPVSGTDYQAFHGDLWFYDDNGPDSGGDLRAPTRARHCRNDGTWTRVATRKLVLRDGVARGGGVCRQGKGKKRT